MPSSSCTCSCVAPARHGPYQAITHWETSNFPMSSLAVNTYPTHNLELRIECRDHTMQRGQDRTKEQFCVGQHAETVRASRASNPCIVQVEVLGCAIFPNIRRLWGTTVAGSASVALHLSDNRDRGSCRGCSNATQAVSISLNKRTA